MKLAHYFPVSIFIFKINHFVLQPLYRNGFLERGNGRTCLRTPQNGVVPDTQVPAFVLVCDALIFLLLRDDLSNLGRAFDYHCLTLDDELLESCEVSLHAKECALVC